MSDFKGCAFVGKDRLESFVDSWKSYKQLVSDNVDKEMEAFKESYKPHWFFGKKDPYEYLKEWSHFEPRRNLVILAACDGRAKDIDPVGFICNRLGLGTEYRAVAADLVKLSKLGNGAYVTPSQAYVIAKMEGNQYD